MIDDTLHTEAALYALDALPSDEAAAFRQKLKDIPGLADLVAEYEEVASFHAEAVRSVPPPSRLRAAILTAVLEKSAAEESPRRMVWLPWALAAGFAFFAGALWVENQRLSTENSGRQTLVAGLSEQLAQANQAAAEKDLAAAELRKRVDELQQRNTIAETQVATLTSKLDGSYLASIAWDNDSQEGILHVRRLPVTASGQDYQLWVVDPNYAAPVSAGVFTVQPDGSATIHFSPVQKITAATAFAVTLEKSGGVPKAEGPVVLSN